MHAMMTPACRPGRTSGRHPRPMAMMRMRSARRRFAPILRVEILQTLQRRPAGIDHIVVGMRALVEVLAADRAETGAVLAAERRERRREDQLLAEQVGEVDLEVRADGLR